MDFFDKIENKEKRNYVFIDYARIIASFLVVYSHMLINISKDFRGSMNDMANVIAFNRCANYIFFIIVGYSFMKSKRDLPIKASFVMLLKNYISLMIFVFPYCFMELLWNNHLVYEQSMIKNSIINGFYGRTWDHLWFMYMLLAIYLLLPFLSKIFKSEDKKVLPIFTLILFLLGLFRTTVTINSPIYMFNWIPFSYALFAVTLGAFLQRYNLFDKINTPILILIVVSYTLSWFKFPFIFRFIDREFSLIIFAMFLILLFSRIFTVKNKIIVLFSSYTFVIYLSHVFFLHILTKMIVYNPYSQFGFIGPIIFSIIVYFLSSFVAFMLKNIPFIKSFY